MTPTEESHGSAIDWVWIEGTTGGYGDDPGRWEERAYWETEPEWMEEAMDAMLEANLAEAA